LHRTEMAIMFRVHGNYSLEEILDGLRPRGNGLGQYKWIYRFLRSFNRRDFGRL